MRAKWGNEFVERGVFCRLKSMDWCSRLHGMRMGT